MQCADGTRCWTPTCCSNGLPCLKWAAKQPEMGPPEPYTVELNRSEWKNVAGSDERR